MGDLIRSEKTGESDGRVLTVTGMVPSPIDAPEGNATKPETVKDQIDEIVTAFIRRARYLLTLKGRPPFRLAGVEMYEQLTELAVCLCECTSRIPDDRLKTLEEGISTALKSFSKEYHDLSLAAKWLREISELLEPDDKNPRTGEQVRIELFKYLLEIKEQGDGNPVLTEFARQISKTTVNYEEGLFHCYDIEGLPRTNNGRESEFRELKRKILKITGQKGATLRYIQRSGAWELLLCPGSLSDIIAAISKTDFEDFCEERQRVRNHRERFRLHTRSSDLANKQLEKLREKWFELSSGEPYE